MVVNGVAARPYRLEPVEAYLEGKPRNEVKIHWHGDETQNEIDFVSRTLDEAYARAGALQHRAPESPVSEAQFGDQIYEACMAGKEL